VITGRDSKPLRARLEALGVQHVHLRHRGQAARRREDPCSRAGLHWAQAAAMGDDWPDLPVLTPCAASRRRRPMRTSRCGNCARYVTQATRPAKAPRASSATCCWWPAASYAQLLDAHHALPVTPVRMPVPGFAAEAWDRATIYLPLLLMACSRSSAPTGWCATRPS
jgi:hypothetical protein